MSILNSTSSESENPCFRQFSVFRVKETEFTTRAGNKMCILWKVHEPRSNVPRDPQCISRWRRRTNVPGRFRASWKNAKSCTGSARKYPRVVIRSVDISRSLRCGVLPRPHSFLGVLRDFNNNRAYTTVGASSLGAPLSRLIYDN